MIPIAIVSRTTGIPHRPSANARAKKADIRRNSASACAQNKTVTQNALVPLLKAVHANKKRKALVESMIADEETQKTNIHAKALSHIRRRLFRGTKSLRSVRQKEK